MKSEEELTLYLIGSAFFKANINRLVKQINGVKKNMDIEYLHRMRVAARKLLNGINTFTECVPKGKIDFWKMELSLLVKELGKARDLDVQILKLKTYRYSLNTVNFKTGIDRLILRLEQSRAKRQTKILNAIIRFCDSSFIQEVNAVFDAAVYRKRVTAKRLSSRKFIVKIRGIIDSKINTVTFYKDKIYISENITELHELRKAVKQVRYTLETFKQYYGKIFSANIRITKNIQEQLGRIHDCDVWLEKIPEFINKEKERTKIFYGHLKNFKTVEAGLLQFLIEVKNEREAEYQKFTAYWAKINRKNFWSSIHLT